ncbi:MAG: TIGR03067 domain-containing protein [Isosphaeraceae bacterium]
MRNRTLFALAALLLTAADDPAATQEQEKFKGRWEIVGVTENGQAVAKSQFGGLSAVFEGENYKQFFNDKVVEEGTYKLDPKAEPKTLDLVIRTGADAGKTQLGLYKFEGKTLVLSLVRAGVAERPKSFESKAGTGILLFTMERAEPGKEKDAKPAP